MFKFNFNIITIDILTAPTLLIKMKTTSLLTMHPNLFHLVVLHPLHTKLLKLLVVNFMLSDRIWLMYKELCQNYIVSVTFPLFPLFPLHHCSIIVLIN